MRPEELWRRVGKFLRERREERRWHNWSDVERHGGPSYQTVKAIEAGEVGNVDSLARHCEALGLELVDVLRDVLKQDERQLSPEASQLVRAFEHTTVAGRQALLLMANALMDAGRSTER